MVLVGVDVVVGLGWLLLLLVVQVQVLGAVGEIVGGLVVPVVWRG